MADLHISEYCPGVLPPMSAYYSHCIRCERAWTVPASWFCYPGCPCARFHLPESASDRAVASLVRVS